MGFAQNLDYLIQMRGMTKYQLAKELGCHQTSVTNWLENGTTPHKRTIEAVASLFGISANELCADKLPDLSKKENPTVSGEVKKLTPDRYGEFLRELPMSELLRLYSEMGEVLKERMGE